MHLYNWWANVDTLLLINSYIIYIRFHSLCYTLLYGLSHVSSMTASCKIVSVPSKPMSSTYSSPLSPWTPEKSLIFSLCTSALSKMRYSWKHWYVTFLDSLLSLRSMHLRFLHIFSIWNILTNRNEMVGEWLEGKDGWERGAGAPGSGGPPSPVKRRTQKSPFKWG